MFRNGSREKTLIDLKKGEIARLKSVEGGERVTKRLYNMGLIPGVELRMFNTVSGGRVIIGVGQGRFALGCGLASRIVVV